MAKPQGFGAWWSQFIPPNPGRAWEIARENQQAAAAAAAAAEAEAAAAAAAAARAAAEAAAAAEADRLRRFQEAVQRQRAARAARAERAASDYRWHLRNPAQVFPDLPPEQVARIKKSTKRNPWSR